MQAGQEKPDPDSQVYGDEIDSGDGKMSQGIPQRHHDGDSDVTLPALEGEQADLPLSRSLRIYPRLVLLNQPPEAIVIHKGSEDQPGSKRKVPIRVRSHQPIDRHRTKDQTDCRPDQTGENAKHVSVDFG